MKRTDSFINNAAKKPKLQLQQPVQPANERNEDIWGDDPEPEEIDKCIEIATQLCSQKLEAQNDPFILPSYNDFHQRKVVCSTQICMPAPIPSCSKTTVHRQENSFNDSMCSFRSTNTVINKDITNQEYQQSLVQEIEKLKLQNKKLMEKSVTKDGEISILRSQLKQTQIAIDNEKVHRIRIKEQNEQEWGEKLIMAQKDVNSLKVDIELKNLEIANLREKTLELKKLQNGKISLLEDSDYSQLSKKRLKLSYDSSIKKQKHESVQTNIDTNTVILKDTINYPLTNVIPNTLFKMSEPEQAYIQLKNSNNAEKLSFRLKMSDSQCDNIFKLISLKDKNFTSISCLYPEILSLMKCSETDIDNEDNTFNINRIIFITIKLLSELVNILNIIQKNTSPEDIRDMDALYLTQPLTSDEHCLFSDTPWCNNEGGINIRRCIAVLAALSIYNTYLYNYLKGSESLEFGRADICTFFKQKTIEKTDNDEILEETIKSFETINSDKPFGFLNLLLELTTQIGKIRRAHQFPGLQSSILQLLSSLFFRNTLSNECYDLVHSIFREIIFSRPCDSVLIYVSKFLKNSTRHENFIQLLCKNANSGTFKLDEKKEIFLFTTDMCTFQILTTLMEGLEKNVNLSHNFMIFLQQSIDFVIPWMYPQAKQTCQCLTKLCSISIEILYYLSEDYIFNKDHIKDTIEWKYYNTFGKGLIFLYNLTLRLPDMIVKCARLYIHYKTFVQNIESLEDSLNFENKHRTALETLLSSIKNDVPKSESVETTSANDIYTDNQFLNYRKLL